MFSIFFFIAMIGLLIFVTVSHPVHTILSLIVVACAVSGICLIMGAEFLGFLFIIIYVGAIAVLFLFVVMMIAVNLLYTDSFNPLNESFGVIGLALVLQMIYFFNGDKSIVLFDYQLWANIVLTESNLVIFNHMLYGGFLSSVLVAAGFLLLISMIGSIFLTVQDYTTQKSQLIYDQLQRVATIFINGHQFKKSYN